MLATTLSIVAVFLPVGFMGGIIGKFFHEFGITIVAAVLISMFVSFTLDPMLSSVWHDPAAHGVARPPVVAVRPQDAGPRHRRLRPLHRGWATPTSILLWLVAAAPQAATLARAAPRFAASFAHPLLGAEFVPRPTSRRPTINFTPPVGSSLGSPSSARQVDAALREFPEVRYTLTTINTGNARASIRQRSTCAWSTARTGGAALERSRPMPFRAGWRASRHHGHQHRPDRPGRQQGLRSSRSRAGRPRASWRGCRARWPHLRHPGPGRPGQHAQTRQADRGHRGEARDARRPG